MAVGRKRLKLYDADEEDEREAEKSVSVPSSFNLTTLL